MDPIPVTILAGSDRMPGALPEGRADLHPLGTYKGTAIRAGGRPLLAHLVERLACVEGFGPVTVAGPAREYRPLGLAATLLDTDGTVEENLRAALVAHRASHAGPIAVLACDVLPTSDELGELRRCYESDQPCALWFPFVSVPDDLSELGAFGWKPVYHLLLDSGEVTVRILPGHLAIFDPETLRLPLLYRLLGLAYRTRNRSVRVRRAVMLRAVTFSLLLQDLRRLAGLRAPTLTATVVGSGLRLARTLRAGRLHLSELERLIGRIFLRTHVGGGRGIRYPIVSTTSLALDIDTQEELSQFQREFEDAAAGTHPRRGAQSS